MAKRKYSDSYFDYGFTFVERHDEQLPQCVVCHKTLSNASIKPHQLKQHFLNVHSHLAGKNRGFFELKANRFKKMRLNSTGQFGTDSKAIVTASYKVSQQVAKAKKPHNIGETLIKPCLVAYANILLGESAVAKMKQVSFAITPLRTALMIWPVISNLNSLQRSKLHLCLEYSWMSR